MMFQKTQLSYKKLEYSVLILNDNTTIRTRKKYNAQISYFGLIIFKV